MSEKISYSFKSRDVLSELSDNAAYVDASPEDLRVLLTLILCDCDVSRAELQKRAVCDAETLTGALQYWRGAGILVKKKRAENTQKTGVEEKAKSADVKEETKTKKKALPSPDRFSETRSDELAEQIERDKLQSLIEACQQTVGKTLSTSEINIIVGMHRELSLDGDYIITLISYCYENDRRSLKYAEKMAFVLTEQGIVSEEDLVAYIEERRRFATLEWQLKKKLGMGNRDFTKKQAEYVHKWEKDYAYGIDVITLAFDITVDSINKAEFKYMNTILTKWHNANCRTEKEVLEFIERENEERKTASAAAAAQGKNQTDKKPKNSTVGDSSFDTDDFFNRALERSYKR